MTKGNEQIIINKNNYKKLFKAHENNITISSKNVGDKFTNFEDSKLDESYTLLYEINNAPKKFKRYFRGEIVRVKFGVNIGSEFSGDHFAIVISKQDTIMNPVLHVIPITSKKHLKSINIGNVLYSENEINKLKTLLSVEDESTKKKNIENVIRYYEARKNVVSYACIEHIKTISKLSINKTFFQNYDYLPLLKCTDDIMNKIDSCIIKEYTNSEMKE